MRLLLGDHHVQARRALKMMLQEEPELELVGEAADAQGLLHLAEAQAPDLVLVDCQLPGGSIEDLISALHARQPRPAVVVMSNDVDRSRKLLRAGVDAFVSKAGQPDWLLDKLRMYSRSVNTKEEMNRD